MDTCGSRDGEFDAFSAAQSDSSKGTDRERRREEDGCVRIQGGSDVRARGRRPCVRRGADASVRPRLPYARFTRRSGGRRPGCLYSLASVRPRGHREPRSLAGRNRYTPVHRSAAQTESRTRGLSGSLASRTADAQRPPIARARSGALVGPLDCIHGPARAAGTRGAGGVPAARGLRRGLSPHRHGASEK